MSLHTFDRFRENCILSPNYAAIIRTLIKQGPSPAGKLAELLELSTPTVSKTLDTLVEEGMVCNLGKQHVEGGRMPVIYSVNPDAAFFGTIAVNRHAISIAIANFSGEIVYRKDSIPFILDSEDSYEQFCSIAKKEFKEHSYKDRLVACTISIPGRVNTFAGESYNYFTNTELPLAQDLEKKLGVKVYLENDSRVICYGEYIHTSLTDYKNVLYVNVNWGLGMGMILDGKLYYGATGFSGELGHITLFENEIFCRCGKKGCLETEASGFAAQRLLLSKHNAGAQSKLSSKIIKNQTITLGDFVSAVQSGDMLMIEIIEEIGSQLGKGIAAMINIFNPQLVILGGELSQTGEYLRMATVSSIRKYSLNIANKETNVVLATDTMDSYLYGGCFIARDRTIGLF